MKTKSVFIISQLSLCFILICSSLYSQQVYKNEKYLMILDVQQYWTDNALTETASIEMLQSINALIGITNPQKIIYITSLPKVLTLSLRGIHVDTVSDGSFDSALLVVNNIVFEKSEGDAFSCPELLEYLTTNNIHEIIITGLLAEKCVFKSVKGGISKGYDIYVLPEALGSKSEKRKMKVIREIEKKGCNILLMSDLFQQMLQ